MFLTRSGNYYLFELFIRDSHPLRSSENYYSTLKFHSWKQIKNSYLNKYSSTLAREFNSFHKSSQNSVATKIVERIRLVDWGTTVLIFKCSQVHYFISQKVETTEIPISGWMDKQNLVHPHNKALLVSHRIQWSMSHAPTQNLQTMH